MTVGRYKNIIREERFCSECNVRAIGDEYHVILERSNLEILRARKSYLPEFFWNIPNNNKFIMLMQTKNIVLRYQLVSLLNVIFKIYR